MAAGCVSSDVPARGFGRAAIHAARREGGARQTDLFGNSLRPWTGSEPALGSRSISTCRSTRAGLGADHVVVAANVAADTLAGTDLVGRSLADTLAPEDGDGRRSSATAGRPGRRCGRCAPPGDPHHDPDGSGRAVQCGPPPATPRRGRGRCRRRARPADPAPVPDGEAYRCRGRLSTGSGHQLRSAAHVRVRGATRRSS